MQLGKFIVAMSLIATSTVYATEYKLQDDAPVHFEARDTLAQYMVKSGKCLELSRIGDSPAQYPHQVSQVLRQFNNDKVRAYVPYMTYSCMVSADPVYAGYIPERYVKKMPR